MVENNVAENGWSCDFLGNAFKGISSLAKLQPIEVSTRLEVPNNYWTQVVFWQSYFQGTLFNNVKHHGWHRWGWQKLRREESGELKKGNLLQLLMQRFSANFTVIHQVKKKDFVNSASVIWIYIKSMNLCMYQSGSQPKTWDVQPLCSVMLRRPPCNSWYLGAAKKTNARCVYKNTTTMKKHCRHLETETGETIL